MCGCRHRRAVHGKKKAGGGAPEKKGAKKAAPVTAGGGAPSSGRKGEIKIPLGAGPLGIGMSDEGVITGVKGAWRTATLGWGGGGA